MPETSRPLRKDKRQLKGQVVKMLSFQNPEGYRWVISVNAVERKINDNLLLKARFTSV